MMLGEPTNSIFCSIKEGSADDQTELAEKTKRGREERWGKRNHLSYLHLARFPFSGWLLSLGGDG